MANKGNVAKNYGDTYLYNKGGYEKHLVNFLMTAEEINKKDESFENIKFDIKRRQIDSCLVKILESNNVKLMIHPVPLPKAFKVFAASDIKTDKKMRVFIDCSDLIKKIDGAYKCNNIDILIAYLVSCISNLVYYADPKRIIMNKDIIDAGARSFSALFTYIIDYLYKISNTPQIKVKCQYLSARYYIECILNKEFTDSGRAACRNLSKMTQREEELLELQIDEETMFRDINQFVDKLLTTLKLKSPEEKSGVEIIIEKWIYLYGTGTQFGLEMFPAFATMMTNCYVGCYINNQKTIEKIAGRNMIDFTKAVLKIGNESVR